MNLNCINSDKAHTVPKHLTFLFRLGVQGQYYLLSQTLTMKEKYHGFQIRVKSWPHGI